MAVSQASCESCVAIPDPINDNGAPLPSSGLLNFGLNVIIFDPNMSPADIQSKVDSIFQIQEKNQFGPERYTLFFKPGTYNVNIQVGFYTTVHGLGDTPDAVAIVGGVTVTAAWFHANATQNFWRAVENLAIIPTVFGSNAMWATSQATWLRRVHVRGSLWLFDWITPGNNWSSGGFIADSVIDTSVVSGSQQQYLTRNCELTDWEGQVWNMVFVGDKHPPVGTWPQDKYTVVPKTPVVREKPYLVIDSQNNYSVVVPAFKRNSQGPSWNGGNNFDASTRLPLSNFYVAKSNFDDSRSLNIALQRGLHLLLTPGVYSLSQPIVVRKPNTLILGLGLATLKLTQDTPALIVADIDGVTIGGILIDAGTSNSPNLLQIGDQSVSTIDHSSNPTVLFDVSFRVGGAVAGAKATTCMVINSRHLILDNVWIWRADHGINPSYVGWDVNPSKNGLIVNSNDVTAYGLFVEHFQGFQMIWNGNGGSVYFYQSEIPYDVPSQDTWMQNGEKGYPAYKVSDNVTSHLGMGIGIYCNFTNVVQLENAIESPANVAMHHLVTFGFPAHREVQSITLSMEPGQQSQIIKLT